jgi:hypothetical protein
MDEGDELRGRKAGVAAELVHLVRCRFDRKRRAIRGSLPHGGFEDRGISGAHGIKARGLAGAVAADEEMEPVGWGQELIIKDLTAEAQRSQRKNKIFKICS